MTPEELKTIRVDKLKVTQRKMAELLNTPFQTYWKWEKGKRRIPGILEVALRTVENKLREAPL